MDILLYSLLALVLIFILLISYFYISPKQDQIDTHELPQTYFIETWNRMDMQENNECAAFSSAFVLRHIGEEADGNDLYKKYPGKLIDGTISPKGILLFFRQRGLKASFFTGSATTLKKRLTQGTPVIVFIRVFPDKRYLHFVPVVGYDEKHFYLADSLNHTINSDHALYNRKIGISELEAVWKTWVPGYINSYIVVDHSI